MANPVLQGDAAAWDELAVRQGPISQRLRVWVEVGRNCIVSHCHILQQIS
jgi:hypothetical protein